MIVVVMGVAGSGKTTIGTMLAETLGYTYLPIRFWDLRSGKTIRILAVDSEGYSNFGYRGSVSFSEDDSILACGNNDDTITLWEVKSGTKLRTLKTDTEPPGTDLSFRSISFNPGETHFVTGNSRATTRNVNTPSVHIKGLVSPFAFGPNGRLASRYDYNKIKLSEVRTGETVRKFAGHESDILAIAYDPTGRTIASASNKEVKLWDTHDGAELSTFVLSFTRWGLASVEFSPDGSKLVIGSTDGTITIWDAKKDGKYLRSLAGHAGGVNGVVFSPNGQLLASSGTDSKAKLWDEKTGSEICSLAVLENNRWVVVGLDGRFDTNKIEDSESLHWVVDDDPLKAVPLDVFLRDYYEPNLLSRLVQCNALRSCAADFPKLPNVTELNRVQPEVKITDVSLPDRDRRVQVTVEVRHGMVPTTECRMPNCQSDAFDLRLFRDGQMVGNIPDDGLERFIKTSKLEIDDVRENRAKWRAATGLNLARSGGTKTFTFHVQLPRSKNVSDVTFSAYAFNEDRVKSRTAKWTWPDKQRPHLPQAERVHPRIIIVSIGVNASENKKWELKYAANDAHEMENVLAETLRASGQFEILTIPLVSEYDDAGRLSVNNATKRKIAAVFALLAGKSISNDEKRTIDEIGRDGADIAKLLETKVTPDDQIFISFSSHGYADNKGNFFLLPYDVGKNSVQMKDAVHSAISSDELSLWLKNVDAGNLVMIIDACHAAASVENREFKPGPMGSRGLGQLAYDKEMKILAATKAADVAYEIGGKLNQGLLSFALLQDGIRRFQADFSPEPDENITLLEWLNYGVMRVPVLYDDVKNDRLIDSKGTAIRSERLKKLVINERSYQQTPNLYNFSMRGNDLILSQRRR